MPEPTRIGKYEIIDEIGRGGFAAVYKARDTVLDRIVALKVLHPYWTTDVGFSERFRREARAAARLRHPNIVTVHETGEIDGQLYIAMEYLPGGTLRELLETEGVLTLEQALPILEQLAEALDYAHTEGVIHRDVKPGNIVVEETTRGIQTSLTDFGLVKAMEGSAALTSQGTLLGSPEYMAPEQAAPERAGEIGPATDRYGLGIVAYQMLTGRVPFPGNTPGTLNAHEHKPVPSPRSIRPELPRQVEAALLTMLAKAPEDRFDTAIAFVARLRAAWQAEIEARQREEELAQLYQKMREAAEQETWRAVLDLVAQIQVLAPDYRDVTRWRERAIKALQTPSPPLLPWKLVAFGLVLVLCLIFGISFGQLALQPISEPTEAATATMTVSPVPTLVSTPPVQFGAPAATIGIAIPPDALVMIDPIQVDLTEALEVPGGTFQMGSEDGDDDEQSVHTVTLDSFWIDETEVTNFQYAAFLNHCGNQSEGGTTWLNIDDEDCLVEQDGEEFQPKSGFVDHPVTEVSWYGAAAYCDWAGARLPTEAEWEYAARGSEGNIYPWGNEGPTCDLAHYGECSGQTVSVGSLPEGASWCGALDMAGNVWEWVADWHDQYPSDPQINPTGPESGEYRVLRGGSWGYDPDALRGANRHMLPPVSTWSYGGFRCARDGTH